LEAKNEPTPVGEPPADIRGTVRITRAGQSVWETPLLTGETNVCHHLSTIERCL
jgi:hypothetical protein